MKTTINQSINQSINQHKLATVSAIRIKQWGVWAFAKHCQKLGISFDDAYWMVFGKYPTRR